MILKWVANLARLAVDRRGFVLVFFAVLVGLFASQLGRLTVDTSPEALVSEIPGQKEAEALFEEHFGRSESQIIVAVYGERILSEDALRYQADLHQALSALQVVGHVDSLVGVQLPARLREPTPLAQGLPPEEANAAVAQQNAAMERASAEGLIPSDQTLQVIVDAYPEAFVDGLRSAKMRFLNAEVAPSFSEKAWTAELFARLVGAIRAADYLRPTLLNDEESAVAQIAHLDASRVFDEQSRMGALADVRQVIETLPRPSRLRVELGGSPVLGEAILKKLEKDRWTLNPAMAVLCLLVLLVTFRWWPAVVAPLLAVGVASLGVMGGLAFLDQPLTILTNIIPPLLLIVGLSDSVHLLGRYREELRNEKDRFRAARSATFAMVIACFLTSLTTAVGFASMASAKTQELQRFGLAAAFGVMLAYLATVFCVPAFVSFFRPNERFLARRTHHASRAPALERFIFGIARWTMKHFKLVTVFSVVSTILLSWLASHVQADARLLDAFEKKEKISQVTGELEEKLSGIRPLEVVLRAPDRSLLEPELIRRVVDSERWLKSDAEVIAVSSFIDPLIGLRSSLTLGSVEAEQPFSSTESAEALLQLLQEQGDASHFISADGSLARMTVYFRDSGIVHTLQVVDELKQRLQGRSGASTANVASASGSSSMPGYELVLLGEAYTGSVGRKDVLRDLLAGLTLALVTIFGLLTLLFRSLPLGLAAMPPNLIPLLATGAYMMARGIQLNLTTVITFSIGIGLAVDDTVHVVARFREESARLSSHRVALLRALRGTGSAIFVTAISLSLGFGVLMLSEFVSVRQFGELIAVTVLNCLFGALVVQPAMLTLVVARRRARARAD